MTSPFLDLSRYDEFALDTETKGQGRNVWPVGCGIYTPDGQKRYMRWGHEAGGNNCTLPEFQRWGKAELKDPQKLMICHAAPYDLRALANVNINVGCIVEDTGVLYALLNEYEPNFSLGGIAERYLGRKKSDESINLLGAARFGGKPTRKGQAGNYWRLSGDEVEEYGAGDPELTYLIYKLKRPEIDAQDLLEVYRLETMVIPVLHRMYQAGVRIDVDRAVTLRDQMKQEFHQVEREWNKYSGGIKFSERKRLIQYLMGLGIDLPFTKKGKLKYQAGDGSDDWSFHSADKAALGAINHPVGGLIQKMRQLSHYSDTFIQSYLLDNVDDLGFIFPNFHQVKRDYGNDDTQTGTITGRFSSSGGLNAQNIPARDEILAPLIRSMFIPRDDDSVWLKADYNSIEYRFFAHYAGGQLRKSYQDNPEQDLHEWVGHITGLIEKYGMKVGRSRAKNVNFAKLYGAGIPKLALTIGCSEEETREIVAAYDARVPEARKLYHKAMNRAAVRGYITTWGGRRLHFQSVGEKKKKYLGTFKSLNKLCQGSSADLIKHAMVAVDQAIDWQNEVLHLTVHDELDLSIPKGSAGLRSARKIKEAMENFELTVPILADIKVGPNWGHGKDLEEVYGQAA